MEKAGDPYVYRDQRKGIGINMRFIDFQTHSIKQRQMRMQRIRNCVPTKARACDTHASKISRSSINHVATTRNSQCNGKQNESIIEECLAKDSTTGTELQQQVMAQQYNRTPTLNPTHRQTVLLQPGGVLDASRGSTSSGSISKSTLETRSHSYGA